MFVLQVWAGAAGGANWAALKQVLGVPSDGRGKKRRRPAAAAANAGNVAQPERRPERISDTEGLTRVLAVDCEMVGVGADGLRSSLARCAASGPTPALPLHFIFCVCCSFPLVNLSCMTHFAGRPAALFIIW